ncbi:LANO_0E04676g1_1 [Lachancea nothofagi CBS 11611]|uniref:LANO_0E04676g1_1 n=1 Tax=Lachancea nothofagi CBS 11611 TaxID=1266666 RepID=A0A1G4JSD8_9SACH|nr:LANO_0E04676g1_1 [Lachancea nothofagi CBS 11611]
MGWKDIGSLLSLKMLDSRLDPGSDAKRIQKASMGATKSRWNTLEFKIYYTVFAIAVPLMLRAVISATNEHSPNFPRFEPLLSQGWIWGRKVDNSDSQYRFFRNNLPLLTGLVLLHTGLKKVVLRVLHCQRTQFDLVFGVFFLFAAHGVNAFRVTVHLLINYIIAKSFRKKPRLAIFLTWVYGIGSLFINNSYRQYPFGNVVSVLEPLDSSFKGLIERWDVFYNFTLLRMLSFNMDFLEKWREVTTGKKSMSPTPTPPSMKPELKRSASSATTLETICENGTKNVLQERARLYAPHHIQDYSFSHYIAYITYTPLFIAGPIITFNDYLYQSQHTLPSINRKGIMGYALRFAICVLTMEVVLHYIYAVAVSKTKAWQGDTPFQISMIGLFNLNIIWLKLLIPWRLFRLWALMDGIDPPENMLRCVNNNYSTLGFWRAWHSSYNKWVVRYIYIPLGGSKSRILTSLAVFSFVAIWHDIELRLLLWGWLIVLVLLPEVFAQKFFAAYQKRPWFRFLCSVGAVFNIWTMMIANLFGFCLGYDGTVYLVKGIFLTWAGIKFLVFANIALFVGTQVMFEQREGEKRKGINVKC